MTAIDPAFKRAQFLALKEAADNGKLTPPKRKSFSRKVRLAVFGRQQGICAKCGEWLDERKFEVDHILERDLCGSNDPVNLEALHPACHRTKTSARAGVLAKVHRLCDETFSTEEREPSRLQGRGFNKTMTKGFDGKVRPRKAKASLAADGSTGPGIPPNQFQGARTT